MDYMANVTINFYQKANISSRPDEEIRLLI